MWWMIDRANEAPVPPPAPPSPPEACDSIIASQVCSLPIEGDGHVYGFAYGISLTTLEPVVVAGDWVAILIAESSLEREHCRYASSGLVIARGDEAVAMAARWPASPNTSLRKDTPN